MKRIAVLTICCMLGLISIAQNFADKRIIVQDDFSVLQKHWLIEKAPADSEKVYTQNNKLIIDTYNGATIWFAQPLKGNILIQYKRKVVMDGTKNCRLSDLNQFFMATDSNPEKLFKRKGGFAEYDTMNMYYVGMGGNYNTTTRFRKYNNGDKKIIGEFTDAEHLLQPNKEYLIEIFVIDGTIQFSVDGKIFFKWKDEQPFKEGYFAFRSTRSRQEISDLKIYQLP